MPIRTCVRHRQASGSSLIDLISGACVRITAPVFLIRRTASARTGGSSSPGQNCVPMLITRRPPR